MSASFAQTLPYPGQDPNVETEPVATQPLIPPLISQAILIIGGLFIVLVFGMIFVLGVLIMIKFIFGSPKIELAEQIRRKKIGESKGWNGTNLGVVELAGDNKSVPPSTIGYCTGFKAESDFDYITYHTGLPGYLFLLRMIKGPAFQIHIPILDINIPSDSIIQIEPELHSTPGRTLLIHASGIEPSHSGYEKTNNSKITIASRMRQERDEVIAQTHGKTASLIPEIAEHIWEGSKEHFKKRSAESSKTPSGR